MSNQTAKAEFEGIIGSINVQKEHVHVMLFVNSANRHGHQVSRKIFNIFFFDTAVKALAMYAQVGDCLLLRNVEIDPSDDETGRVYFRVKRSTDVKIVAHTNRQTLLARITQD